MEDRKRPLSTTDDVAPPSKRQAVNGGNKTKEDSEMKDEAWIEDYQKDAIYRQMQEYKREKATLEVRLDDLTKRSTHHDDHLRVVDAWWLQLLQEVEVLASSSVSFQPDTEGYPFPTQSQFSDLDEFKQHLTDKATSIKDLLQKLFVQIGNCRGPLVPDVGNLEKEVNQLLAKQKDFLVKLDRLTSDKDSLSDQLNNATLRYLKAERKLDRAKSTQVQKLEQQALANATGRPANITEQENGTVADESNGNSETLQSSLREANAVTIKQQEQLETALAQSKALQEELTSVQIRLTNLTDEDYSRTEVFKLFKGQHDDLLKKLSHLEAENQKVRTESKKLTEERELARKTLKTEAESLIASADEDVQNEKSNVVRIRAQREELSADLQILKAGKEQEKMAYEHMKELVSAKEQRIAALESEVQRLQPSEDLDMTARPEIDDMPPEDLREKYKKLMRDYDSIVVELPGMTAAVKKFQALANKKVLDFAAHEERLLVAQAEKTKADQKYFNVRKDGEGKNEEIKRLRSQNGKSSEIISQLKDVEAHNRTLATNLEKQLADLKQSNTSLISENKKLEASSHEVSRRYDALKQQVNELTNLTKSKDSTTAMARERNAALEAEIEKLKVRLDTAAKDRDKWKTKSLSNTTEEEEMLRRMATCSICKRDFKNTVIRTCGHIFCRSCVDDRLSNRMRKCPNCNKAFDKSDAMTVHLG
ncbi:E3 ubiquitin-protein ligase BRE1 [Xylariaceae sp. FL0016]|nr:E3 ubiquitin-protein ligase BRE1 [Xylariaceae sp. FL0016]